MNLGMHKTEGVETKVTYIFKSGLEGVCFKLRFRQKLLSTTWLRLLRRQVDSPKSTFLVLSTNQSYESSVMSAAVECLNLCVDFIFVDIVSKFDADFAFLTKSTHIIARIASRQCRRQKQGISVIIILNNNKFYNCQHIYN